MKANFFLHLLFGLLPSVFLFSACSSAKIAGTELDQIKTMKTPFDQALVYIVRPEGYWGAAIRFDVTCDDKAIGSTKGKNFIYALLPPGPHRFVTAAENKSEFLLAAEAGKTYFLRQEVKMGVIMARSNWKHLENEVEARKILKKCRLSDDCAAYKNKKQ